MEMGGYGAFVWPAFALTAVALIGLLLVSLHALRAREAELRRLRGDRTARLRTPAAESGALTKPPAASAHPVARK